MIFRCVTAPLKLVADTLERRPYSSREFIRELGKYLVKHSVKKDSLVQVVMKIMFPFSVLLFLTAVPDLDWLNISGKILIKHVTIDSVRDFRELTMIKMEAETSGLFMIGGGVPKNFAQDTVVCAEILGKSVPMHKYAVQITVADVRDGACSSSTLTGSFFMGQGRYQI